MAELMAKYPGFFIVVGTAGVCILQFLVMRSIRAVDEKMETLLVANFGDGKDNLGSLARLAILVHDYAKCCGDKAQRRASDPAGADYRSRRDC